MYRFNGRTVQPFLATAPGGYGNSTSRWQTSGSIRTLARYYTVIPWVTQFIITQSTKDTMWFTRSDLRPCSIHRSHSQANLCSYTQNLISNEIEFTFESLRYFLEGCRPNKTVFHTILVVNNMISRLVSHISFKHQNNNIG